MKYKGETMKKLMAIMMVGAMMLTAASVQAEQATGRGGVMGFVAGCCFGIRAGSDYNSGKEVHWREWVRIVPIAGFVCAIWDGVDGANGVTRAQYAEQYGSMFY